METRKIERVRATSTLTNVFVATNAIHCLPYDFFTLLIDYERDDALGAVSWKIEYSLDGDTWYQSAIYDGGAVAANNDSESSVQREEFEYGGTANEQEHFVFGQMELNQFAKFIRFSFAETGKVADPGDCGATLVLTRRKQSYNN